MASSKSDFRIVLAIVIGFIVFWAIALPAIIKGNVPAGAGPQPTSTGGGTGA